MSNNKVDKMEKMVPGDIEMGELGLPQPDDETAPLH